MSKKIAFGMLGIGLGGRESAYLRSITIPHTMNQMKDSSTSRGLEKCR